MSGLPQHLKERTWAKNAPTVPVSETSPVLLRLSDVQPEEISWHWHPFIPNGKVSIILGDGGLGKSFLTLALASANSTGSPLPGTHDRREPGNTIILSAEDDPADTIRPRLDALGADVTRIDALIAKRTTDDQGATKDAGVTLADIPILRQAVDLTGNVSLIIIDPLSQYLGSGVDLHRSNEIRPLLTALADLAAEYNLAVIVVHHNNKNVNTKGAYRAAGSYDITAAVRSVIVVGEDPQDDKKRVIAHLKSNLAAKGASLGFEIREGSFYWTGGSDYTAEQLLSQPATGEERSLSDEAAEWLTDMLRSGARAAKELKQAATAEGFSWRTVERAKASLGIKASRASTHPSSPWEWVLPEALRHPPTHTQVADCGGVSENASRTGEAIDRHSPPSLGLLPNGGVHR